MRGLILLAAAGLVVAHASAQSLGEAARREKEKRKEKDGAEAGHVYTEADLPKKPKTTPTPTPDPDSALASALAAAVAGTHNPEAQPPDRPFEPSSDPGADRRGWQQRAENARREVESARQKFAELRTKLELLKSPFHPTTPFGHGNPDLPKVEAELKAAGEALAKAEKAQADLVAAAAQARVPTHWLEP